MNMTNEEIVRDYKLAKTKQKQIGILADLNQCKKADIVEILKAAGQELPGNYNRSKAATTATVQEPPVTEAPIPDELEHLRRLIEEHREEIRRLRSDNEALRELVIRLAMQMMGVTNFGR